MFPSFVHVNLFLHLFRDMSFICSQFGKQTVFMSEVEQSNPELFRNVLAV